MEEFSDVLFEILRLFEKSGLVENWQRKNSAESTEFRQDSAHGIKLRALQMPTTSRSGRALLRLTATGRIKFIYRNTT